MHRFRLVLVVVLVVYSGSRKTVSRLLRNNTLPPWFHPFLNWLSYRYLTPRNLANCFTVYCRTSHAHQVNTWIPGIFDESAFTE